MDNRVILNQLRSAIKEMIDQSPSTVTITRKATKDDGFGGTIINPFGAETTKSYTVRISHERKGPDDLESGNAGLSTNLSRYLTFEYSADIIEGDVFTAIGKRFRVGPVDPLVKFGGTVGCQAPLFEAADAVDSPEDT